MHLSLCAVLLEWETSSTKPSGMAGFLTEVRMCCWHGGWNRGKASTARRNQRKCRAEPPGRSREHHSYFWEDITEEGGREGGGWAAEDTQKQEVQSSTSKISRKETDVLGAHLAASPSNREGTRGLNPHSSACFSCLSKAGS